MTDRVRTPARRTSLAQTIATVAVAALTSAAFVWSALFYNAAHRHASAIATHPAPIVQATPAGSAAAQPPTTTVAPVTTRTS
jgi:hypothetical protein